MEVWGRGTLKLVLALAKESTGRLGGEVDESLAEPVAPGPWNSIYNSERLCGLAGVMPDEMSH